MNEQRTRRVSEEVKKVIAELLLRDLKDPGISSMTTVSDVRVTRDLSYANVYISVLGSEEEKQSTLEALERAKGFIRSEVGKALKLRVTPDIILHLDESIEQAMELGRLIDEVIQEDEAR